MRSNFSIFLLCACLLPGTPSHAQVFNSDPAPASVPASAPASVPASAPPAASNPGAALQTGGAQPGTASADTAAAASAPSKDAASGPATPAAPATSAPAERPHIVAVPGTLENLFKAAIRLNAFDLNDDHVIDDFAKVVHCDIFRQYHDNEFDWRRVRAAMRKSIKMEMDSYPLIIYFEKSIDFTAYDFSSGTLDLAPASAMRHLTMLGLLGGFDNRQCGSVITSIPQKFVGQLDEPIQIESLTLTEDEARQVVTTLKKAQTDPDKPVTRIGYARFVVDIRDLQRKTPEGNLLFDAHMRNIILYTDDKYTQPFWSGTSTIKTRANRPSKLDDIPFKGIDPSVSGN